jgi:Prolyl oligopeptidase family
MASLDLRSGELSLLDWPAAKGWLLDFVPEHATAVPVAVDPTGSRLWVSKPAFDEHRTVVETNTWLCDIAEGEIRRVDYRGLDARGYALLLPSMPLKAESDRSDPYLELTKGVLPAVDKAIELGIAHANRLGLIGQSYGGYGTYGLITQTSRFKAAVALAGFADLVGCTGSSTHASATTGTRTSTISRRHTSRQDRSGWAVRRGRTPSDTCSTAPSSRSTVWRLRC